MMIDKYDLIKKIESNENFSEEEIKKLKEKYGEIINHIFEHIGDVGMGYENITDTKKQSNIEIIQKPYYKKVFNYIEIIDKSFNENGLAILM